MKMRRLGRAGPEVSAIGFGCGPLSSKYGTVDESDAIATIHRAIDLGVTLFDTADIYGNGHEERLLGRAVRGHRDKVVLATKFGGVVADPNTDQTRGVPATSGYDGRPEYVRTACEASLHRLGIETIDLYQLHRVDPNTPIEDTIGALADLVREGKVRYIGMSEARESDLRRAAAVHPVASLQSEYSLFERGVEDGILDVCEQLGIGFIPFTPLGRGLLAGSFTPETVLEADDVRLSGMFPRLAPEHLRANVALVQVIRDVGAARGATSAQVALAWLLSRRPWVVPIPGSDRIAYLEENVQSAELELDAADLERLDGLAASVHGPRAAAQVQQGRMSTSPPKVPAP